MQTIARGDQPHQTEEEHQQALPAAIAEQLDLAAAIENVRVSPGAGPRPNIGRQPPTPAAERRRQAVGNPARWNESHWDTGQWPGVLGEHLIVLLGYRRMVQRDPPLTDTERRQILAKEQEVLTRLAGRTRPLSPDASWRSRARRRAGDARARDMETAARHLPDVPHAPSRLP
jgi:hypothetical protein